jgi:hypothetical protein
MVLLQCAWCHLPAQVRGSFDPDEQRACPVCGGGLVHRPEAALARRLARIPPLRPIRAVPMIGGPRVYHLQAA